MRSSGRISSERRGFALIVILWLIVAMAAIGLDDTATTQDSLATAQNRMNIIRATWHAEGCGEVARAVTDAALGDTLVAASAAWDTLDRTFADVQGEQLGCAISARAAGDRLDVNEANTDAISATFVAAGVGTDRADSLADAIADWRDADSIPRPSGAEIGWYRRAGRLPPFNHQFDDENEIRLVRGFESADSLIALLGVEPGKIVLDRAPIPVIASLPGMTAESIARIAEMRWRKEPITDIRTLEPYLSADSRTKLESAFQELANLIASEPDAWIVRLTSTAGTPPVTVVEELRLVRAGRRAGITRAKIWP